MSTVATAERTYTAEEFFRLPEPPGGSKDELVRGRIVTMAPTGFEHGVVQGIVAFLLRAFVDLHQLGRVAVGSGVITERNPDSVRDPDVSFWSFERLPKENTPMGYPEVVADLCVEVRSPDQSQIKLLEKVLEYLACGVRIVWIVDLHNETVTTYSTSNGETVTTYVKPHRATVHSGEDIVSGNDVLPGFAVPASKFFR